MTVVNTFTNKLMDFSGTQLDENFSSIDASLALKGAANLIRPSLSPGPIIAILGDSISSNNTVSTSTLKEYVNRSYMTWFNFLSNRVFNFTIANNFGHGGDTLSAIAVRVPDVIAAQPDICIVQGGRNSIVTGETFSTMKTKMLSIINSLLNEGICVVVLTIQPDNALTATQQKIRDRFNRWLLELGYGRADLVTDAALGRGLYPIVVDVRPYIEDNTSGNWLSGFADTDNIHPNTTGGYWMGKAIWDALGPALAIRHSAWSSYADIYDATNNPAGNLLTLHSGTMAGTTGTKTTGFGFTPSGNLATGWTIAASSVNTSTATCVCSKENPRTDGPNSGERQHLIFANSGAGGALDQFSMYQTSIGSGNVSAGDVVYAEAKLQHVSNTKVTSIQMQLQESGPASPQSAYDMAPEAQPYPNVALSGTMRTPALTLQSGTTSLTLFFSALLDTTAATAALEMYLSDVKVWKQTT